MRYSLPSPAARVTGVRATEPIGVARTVDHVPVPGSSSCGSVAPKLRSALTVIVASVRPLARST
jgi:hypothetical protein